MITFIPDKAEAKKIGFEKQTWPRAYSGRYEADCIELSLLLYEFWKDKEDTALLHQYLKLDERISDLYTIRNTEKSISSLIDTKISINFEACWRNWQKIMEADIELLYISLEDMMEILHLDPSEMPQYI